MATNLRSQNKDRDAISKASETNTIGMCLRSGSKKGLIRERAAKETPTVPYDAKRGHDHAASKPRKRKTLGGEAIIKIHPKQLKRKLRKRICCYLPSPLQPKKRKRSPSKNLTMSSPSPTRNADGGSDKRLRPNGTTPARDATASLPREAPAAPTRPDGESREGDKSAAANLGADLAEEQIVPPPPVNPPHNPPPPIEEDAAPKLHPAPEDPPEDQNKRHYMKAAAIAGLGTNEKKKILEALEKMANGQCRLYFGGQRGKLIYDLIKEKKDNSPGRLLSKEDVGALLYDAYSKHGLISRELILPTMSLTGRCIAYLDKVTEDVYMTNAWAKSKDAFGKRIKNIMHLNAIILGKGGYETACTRRHRSDGPKGNETYYTAENMKGYYGLPCTSKHKARGDSPKSVAELPDPRNPNKDSREAYDFYVMVLSDYAKGKIESVTKKEFHFELGADMFDKANADVVGSHCTNLIQAMKKGVKMQPMPKMVKGQPTEQKVAEFHETLFFAGSYSNYKKGVGKGPFNKQTGVKDRHGYEHINKEDCGWTTDMDDAFERVTELNNQLWNQWDKLTGAGGVDPVYVPFNSPTLDDEDYNLWRPEEMTILPVADTPAKVGQGDPASLAEAGPRLTWDQVKAAAEAD